MKKVILIAVIAILGIASAQGQTELVLTDTILPTDLKTKYIVQEVNSAKSGMLPWLLEQSQQEQAKNDSVLNFEVIKQFYIGLNNLANQYYEAVAISKDVMYTMNPSDYAMKGSVMTGHVFGYEYYLNGDTLTAGIIQQFDEAQVRIDEAKANPDLDYVGGTKLVAELELTKQLLVATFNRLEAIKP